MDFFLFAAFALYLSWLEGRQPDGEGMIWVAAASLGLLLVSVLIHELGHYGLAVYLGGGADRLVLGPLGGVVPVKTIGGPAIELLVQLGGPLANLLVSMLSLGVLLAAGQEQLVPGLLHPLYPTALLTGAAWIVALKLLFWINWTLLVVNLVPAFPFDGGRAVRAGLAAAWPELGRRRATVLVSSGGKLVALALVVLAYFAWDGPPAGLVPTWFALLLLAVLLFFAAKYEEDRQEESEPEDHLFGYDFSQGYTSLERSCQHQPAVQHTNFVMRWLERRRDVRIRRQRQQEAEEEQRVDEILSRLHSDGMQCLSQEDRLVLERVSARYRNRHGHSA